MTAWTTRYYKDYKITPTPDKGWLVLKNNRRLMVAESLTEAKGFINGLERIKPLADELERQRQAEESERFWKEFWGTRTGKRVKMALILGVAVFVVLQLISMCS